MPEASPAQGTLKRLIEAEDQAREILQAADEQAQQTIAQATEQAKRSVDAARQEASFLLRSRLEQVDSEGAQQMNKRLGQAEAEAREFERLAQEHLSAAVEMVVDWATFKGK